MVDLRRFFKLLNVAFTMLLLACTMPEKVNDNAQLQQGTAAYETGDYNEAFRLLQPLAEQGNAQAQSILGWLYENGEGVTQDDKQALEWYQKAANQEHAMSQYNLGWMYHQGHGTAIAQNFQQAKAWYQKVLVQPDTEENDEAKALARENLQKLESMGIR